MTRKPWLTAHGRKQARALGRFLPHAALLVTVAMLLTGCVTRDHSYHLVCERTATGEFRCFGEVEGM